MRGRGSCIAGKKFKINVKAVHRCIARTAGEYFGIIDTAKILSEGGYVIRHFYFD